MRSLCFAMAIVAIALCLPGCNVAAPPPALVSPPPILTLRIHEGIASPIMPNASSTTSGGSAKDGPSHKSECKFQVDYPQQGEAKTFSLRGVSIHIGADKNLPEEQRNTFKLTADSESTISVSVRVECRAAIKVLLDGQEVAAPVKLTAGRHQLTITGRFEPK